MSEYEKLKKAVVEAREHRRMVFDRLPPPSPNEIEAEHRKYDDAIAARLQFEEGAAALIEAAHDELKKWCEDFCRNTPCGDCMTMKLIEKMEAIWRKD